MKSYSDSLPNTDLINKMAALEDQIQVEQKRLRSRFTTFGWALVALSVGNLVLSVVVISLVL